MPSHSSKAGFYAVRKGRISGIYSTWAECEEQTKGFHGAKYKKFASFIDAKSFMSESLSDPSDPAVSSNPTPSDVKGKKRAFGPEISDTTGWDVVYSDGACKGNGKVGSIAGVGVWWGEGDTRNIAERCPGDQTNNRAELIAIMRVLETTAVTKKPLLIRTDSQYSIQCFLYWMARWQQNNWKTSSGDDVKNAGIIRCISKHLDIRAKLGQRVQLEYVKGHSGEVGNDGADAMANKGALLPETAERDWKAIEKGLDKQLSNTDSDDEVPKLTVLAPALGGNDIVEVPGKIQKISEDKEAFSMSKIVAENSTLDNSAVMLLKRPPSANNLSGPSANQSGHRLSLSSNTKHDTDRLHKSPQKPISIYPHISGEKSPLTVACAHPPLVPVAVEDININDYGGCLLDDDDLANEVFD